MILGLHASVMLTPQIRWNHPRDSAFQKYRWHPKSLMAPWIIDGRPDLGNFSLILIDTSTPSAALIVHPFNLFMMGGLKSFQGLLSYGDNFIKRKDQVLLWCCSSLLGSREGWRKKFYSYLTQAPLPKLYLKCMSGGNIMRTGRRWREVTINQASTTGTPSPRSHLPIRITHIRKINLCLRQMKIDKYVWVVHKYKSTFLWVPLSCPQPIFSTPSALICHQSAALKRAVTVTIAIEKQNNLSVVLLEFESHIENGTDAWIQQSESAFVQY